jgi:hypothetical protein
MQIVVKKLEKEIYAGYKMRNFKWQVAGPGDEVQNFFSKKNAENYKKIRARSRSFEQAQLEYARS